MMELVESVWDSLPSRRRWERSRACRAFAMKGAFKAFCGVKVRTVRPVQQLCASPDVSGIDDLHVLGQTEVSIQVGWKNPPAEVDYFRLTATDPSGQEEELSVRRSQEVRTKHTIVGQLCDTTNLLKIRKTTESFMTSERRLHWFSKTKKAKKRPMWCCSVIQSCSGADGISFLLLIEMHLFCRPVSRNRLPDFGAGCQRSRGRKAVFSHWRHRSAFTSQRAPLWLWWNTHLHRLKANF